jgi:hypothetical protein
MISGLPYLWIASFVTLMLHAASRVLDIPQPTTYGPYLIWPYNFKIFQQIKLDIFCLTKPTQVPFGVNGHYTH